MKIFYKIDGHPVDRSVFSSIITNSSILNVWESVVEENKQEIEQHSAAVIFKIIDRKFHVLTETSLLFKLAAEVKNKVHFTKKVTQLI